MQSPDELIASSPTLSSLEQMQVFRWVRDERSDLLTEFCAFEHGEDVEFSCGLLENRPHLLDQKQQAKKSILHGYQPTRSSYSTKEAFILVQKQNSPQDIAKICNAISDSVMRSECYFVSADSYNNKKGTQAFQDMITLCLASGSFVQYCLSHIRQRLVFPSYTADDEWKEWNKRFSWLEAHQDPDVRMFGTQLMTTIAFRVVGEMKPLCWSEIHNQSHIESKLREALVFFRFQDLGDKRDFYSALSQWDELFFPLCTGPITLRELPKFAGMKPIPFSGKGVAFLGGYNRQHAKDILVDRALFLVESAYMMKDRFVLHDALRHEKQIVKERAKRLLLALEK